MIIMSFTSPCRSEPALDRPVGDRDADRDRDDERRERDHDRRGLTKRRLASVEQREDDERHDGRVVDYDRVGGQHDDRFNSDATPDTAFCFGFHGCLSELRWGGQRTTPRLTRFLLLSRTDSRSTALQRR